MNTQSLIAAVDRHKDLIYSTFETIWKNPETGYKEWKTTKLAEEIFEDLSYELHRAGDIPGFYTDIDTGRPGPMIALMGELDSVICASHPEADPETGAVHACGHCAQMAGLVGLAAALKEPGVLDSMSGKIRLMAVPAEELLEIGFRDGLRKNGTIHYYGGKVEFLYRGYFDGVDLAMMVHSTHEENALYHFIPGSNGCLLKNVTYTGKAAHAGGSPHLGINALYAATIGMQAVNSLRETFVEKDYIRFHPIITEGGQMVNAIPDRVQVESYVRGASWEAILKANEAVNRALAGGALAMGANLVLGDRPGYSPLHNDPNLQQICIDTMKEAFGPDSVRVLSEWNTGSTDMGDISTVMPAIHVYAAGAVGHGHGADYYIVDRDKACVGTSYCLLLTTEALLRDGAKAAMDVIRQAQPVFKSKEEYFALMDSLFLDGEAVCYEDGVAKVHWK